MHVLRRLISWLRRLTHRRRVDDGLDEELAHYFDSAVTHRVAQGVPRDIAVREAHRELGSREAIRAAVRDTSRVAWLEGVWRDGVHACRLLRRHPAFTAATVVPLTIGIGAAVTVYSAAYGVLQRPLPVEDEHSLAIGYERRETGDTSLNYPRYLFWRDSGTFASLAASSGSNFTLLTGGIAEQLRGAGVSGNFFEVLGVRPLRGRLLGVADAESRAAVAVISHALWMRLFDGAPDVIGQTLAGGPKVLTIVGVAPPGFERWRGEAHLWVPIEVLYEPSILSSVGYSVATPIARLRPDVTLHQTEARLAAVDAAYMESVGSLQRYRANATRAALVGLRDDVVPPTLRRTLAVLLAAVALTALVICAHVANLVLARGLGRSSEIAVRLAIGAHRRRIVRQLAIESLVLAVPAGLAGWIVAYWGVQLIVAFGPPGIAGNESIRVDWPVALFAAGLTIVTAVTSAVGPAFRLSRTSLQSAGLSRIAPRRLSGTILTLELVMAVVVLVGASLLVRSFARLTDVSLGFDPANLLVVRYDLTETMRAAGNEADRRMMLAQTQHSLLASLAAVPGVTAAGFGPAFRPVSTNRSSIWLEDGRRFLNGDRERREYAPRSHRVSAGYFRLHRIPVIQGREFTGQDDERATRVVVVNEMMAAMLWPGQSPIGHRVNFRGQSPVNGRLAFTTPWSEIVGVVGDARLGSPDAPILPEIYMNIAQDPAAAGYVFVKTTGDPGSLSTGVQNAIRAVDGRIPVYLPRTLSDLVGESTAMTRYNAALLSICAVITTLLGGFGVYSLLAYAIASRRRELGIRIALGAAPARLAGALVKEAGWLAAIGVTAGLLLAAFATGVLSSLLYEVSPRDPLAFAGAGAAVLLLTLIAAWIPARSASRLNPVRALKID